MPLALPGVVDTGTTRSVTVGCSFNFRDSHGWRLEGGCGQQANPPLFDGVYFNDWIAYNSLCGGICDIGDPHTPGWQGTYEVWVKNTAAPIPGGTPDVQVHTGGFACRAQFLPGSQPSDVYSSSGSETTGPFRLGVVIQPGDATPWFPEFWTHFQALYTWWADEDTTKVSTFCGLTVTQHAAPAPSPFWSTAAHPGMTPRGAGNLGFLLFGGKVAALDGVGDVDVVDLTGLATDGWSVDTSELPLSGIFSRSGGGATHNTVAGSSTFNCSAPVRFNYDVDVTKFGNGTTGARLFDRFENIQQLHSDGSQKTPQSDYLTCPISNPYIVPITSWETHKKGMVPFLAFDITPAWAAMQDPPLRADDLQVPLWINPARISPDGGGATYQGVSAFLPSSLSVEFPAGPGEPRASHWTINNGAYGSVTENAGSTVFHVADTRAVFTRSFLSHWRAWTASPFPHGIEAYEVTKHGFFGDADDVWAWDSYGWLQIPNTAPAAGVANLQVAGVWLEVSDPHTTGSDRASSYSQTEHPFSFGYAVPLVNGAGSPFIDLLFPASGGAGPVYPSRVDSLALSGLPVGDTTVTDIQLITRHDGYLKNDYGPPVQRQDYSCLHASQDGAFPWGNWPDEALKPDEIGSHPPYGGALRYIEYLTGSETGTILDRQYGLAELVSHWNRLEGWQVSWDSAAFATANTDPFGASPGYEYACWLRPQTPHLGYAPGGTFHPPCAPMVRQVAVCNALPFAVYVRFPIWGAFEELIPNGAGGRAAAGVPVVVIRDDTSAVVLTANTDASGYVTLSPVPANGARQYHLSW